MEKKSFTKWLIALSVLVMITIVGSGVFAKAPYDKYAGITLTLCFPGQVQTDALKKFIPEVERETGFKIRLDELAFMRMHEKQLLEMAKPVGQYDLISMVCFWKTEYVKPGLLAELAQFRLNAELADPEWDVEDFVPAYMGTSGLAKGTLYAIPFGAETSMLVYRKDLFDKHGLTPPDTYDEILDVSKFFAENVPGVYGLTMRGKTGHEIGHEFLLFLSPFGGTIFDENWRPAFNKKPAIEAIEYMIEIAKYGPPGIPSFNWGAMNTSFCQGKAALYLDATAFGIMMDPKKSKVYDKIAFALHPKHKVRSAETGGFAICIPDNSAKKEAAFLLLQFLTSKESDKRLVELGGAPFRMSTVNDPELQKNIAYFKVLAENLKYANPDWRPLIPEWPEVETDHIGIALSEVLLGKKPAQEAMDAEVGPVTKIMEQAGYYTWQK